MYSKHFKYNEYNFRRNCIYLSHFIAFRELEACTV